MTRSYSAIDLPNLPAPQVITPISPENELQGLLRLFKTYFPDYDDASQTPVGSYSNRIEKNCREYIQQLPLTGFSCEAFHG